MRKSSRIVFGILGALVALILLAPFLITWNQYKALIEEKASAAIGRDVKINGNVRFGLLPAPYAKMTDLVIANPPGTASAQFATVKSIDVGIALAPLFSKDVRLTHIDVKRAAVTLEKMANGQNNWQFAPQENPEDATDTSDPSKETAFSIDDFTLEKAHIRYIDVASKTQHIIGPVNGKFKIASLTGPITGKGDLTVNDALPANFETAIDVLPVEADGIIPFSVNLTAAGDSRADIKGQWQKGESGGLRAETALSFGNPEKILTALSKDKPPEIPAFLAKNLRLSGLTTWRNDKLEIGNLMLNAGGMEVTGSLEATMQDRKTVVIDLDRVVLPPEMKKEGREKDSKADSRNLAQKLSQGFQKAASFLDTSLPKTQLDLVLTATQFPLPQVNLRDLRLAASLTPQGTTIQNLETKLPGNTLVKLNGTLPAQKDGKIAQADINASINSQDIQAALGNADTSKTPLNATTRLVLTRQNLRLQPLQIAQNGQTVQGNITYDPRAENALVVALNGGALNLDAFMSSPQKAQAKSASAQGGGQSSGNPLAALEGLKARITADLDSVTYKKKTANDVAIQALVSNGLQLQRATIGSLGGMNIQASGRIGQLKPLRNVEITAKAATSNMSQTLRALGNNAAQNLGASKFNVVATGSGENLKLDINGIIDQGKLAINGEAENVNTAPRFSGTVGLSHPETATILRNFFGLKPTANLGAFALNTEMTYGAGTIKANDLTAKLGSAGTVQGDVNIIPNNGSRSIDANLKAGKLALSALTGSGQETSRQQTEAKSVQNKDWSRNPIKLEGLRNLNGQANIAIGELLYQKFVIRDFNTAMKFSGSTISVNSFRGKLFDAGNFSINGQLQPGAANQAHRGNFAVNVSDADAKKLFEALGSKPFSEGKVDWAQKIAFNGISQYDIVRSLDGDGTAKVTDGIVNGIDLDALAAKLDRPNSLSDFAAIIDQTRAGGQTKIGNLSAPVLIRNGVVSMNNIAIKTEKTAMALSGAVHLPPKTVDITGQITFVEQRNLPPLTLRLTGPMNAPNKSFDTGSFTQFYAQKAAQKATEKLQERAGKELNKLFGIKEPEPEPGLNAPETVPSVPATTPTLETPAATPPEMTSETPAATTKPEAPQPPVEPTVEKPAPVTTTPDPTPAPTPAKPDPKPEDALKELGGQLLNDFLSGGQR